MSQFVREYLSDNLGGKTRSQLLAAMREHPHLAARYDRNPPAFLHTIRRLILRGELDERDGLIVASETMRRRVLDARKGS